MSARQDGARAARDTERLSAGALVLALFVALCSVYGWLAWRHGTPWLFSDELENSQLSRSIAETGGPARRGEPLDRISLYAYVLAPVWWLHSTAAAYSAAKYLNVAVMTSAIFPTYLLARTIVGRPAALFAATGSVAVPALVYSSFLVEEPLAYAWSALCLLLIARALATRRRALAVAAAAASLVAPLVRNELAVLPAVYALAALWLVWRSEWARARRRGWGVPHWAGAVVLFALAAIAADAFMASQSLEWEVATRHWRGRMLDYGLWAAGALTIGLGVFPVVAGLAGAWRPRNEAHTPADRAFTATLAAALGVFGLYTAVKAAYISTVFSTLVVERNLFYVVPLLFVSTAVVLERRRVRPAALAAAAAFVAYVIATTPYKMEVHFYSDAPGLAILAWLNRTFAWTPGHAQTVLLWMLAVSTLVLGLALLPRTYDRGVRYGLAAAAALTLAWTMTGAITGARASNSFSTDLLRNLPKPLDWVDRMTGRQPTLYIGQQFADPNGVWSLEFWNRSIRKVWSIDSGAPAPGPGPTLTPDPVDGSGRLSADPGYRWAVADRGVFLVGDVVAETGNGWRLYRLQPPLRLARAVTGVFSDGWIGVQGQDPKSVTATYSSFATESSQAGTVFVTVSRRGWCGADVPGRVLIRVGELGIGADRQPVIRRVTQERGWFVHSCTERIFPIPTPKPPFHVTVTVTPPFVPAEVAPEDSTDLRRLGAQVAFSFSEGDG